MAKSELTRVINALSKQEKVVLLSIQPRFSRLIFSGKKTVELRKRIPKYLGRFVLVYESTPTKLVIGILKVRKTEIRRKKQLLTLLSKACVPRVFFDQYYAGSEMGAYYEIEKAILLKKAIPLTELRNLKLTVPQDYRYLTPTLAQEILSGG